VTSRDTVCPHTSLLPSAELMTNRKTQNLDIRQAALCLQDRFNLDVPKTVDELCSLPGLEPKMADVRAMVMCGQRRHAGNGHCS